jgi:hypothetical protein
MAVESSTRKRLIERGISVEHAHKLADGANLDAIKRMPTEQVAKKIGLEMGDSVLDNIMSMISEAGLLHDAYLEQNHVMTGDKIPPSKPETTIRWKYNNTNCRVCGVSAHSGPPYGTHDFRQCPQYLTEQAEEYEELSELAAESDDWDDDDWDEWNMMTAGDMGPSGCGECCDCNGCIYHEVAYVDVFCKGDSCGMPTTMTFYIDHKDPIIVNDWTEWTDDEAISGEALYLYINNKLEAMKTGGKFLCEDCRYRDEGLVEDGTDTMYEKEANFIEGGFCENCGNSIEINRSMGNHTKYRCDVCGHDPPLDSQGTWKTDEPPESQRFGKILRCNRCGISFAHENFDHEMEKCLNCAIQAEEDSRDENADL